jgi:succinate dehydrogenase/fumarate reductase flavoprotein subunit
MGYVTIDPEHPAEGWERWHPHNGRGFTQALEKRARELGVTILTETPVSNLVVERGRVVGVVAKDINKNPIAVHAKAVALNAGGFLSNEDMVKTYCAPELVTGSRPWSPPASQGQGIRMAQGVGAATIGMADIETWDGGVERELGTFGVYTAANQG